MTLLLFLLALWAPQQHDGHTAAADSPATLMPGLGRLRHPIATTNADAQRFFDQGLTLVYGFNHDEAVRAAVLQLDALHICANHYHVPALEASRTPDRALPSARRPESLVPAAGHLAHMPAHIYMRTGDYDGAVTSNARAAEVDRAYIK